MSKPVSEMTLEELEYERNDIERRCYHWKSSKDGSYEMALNSKGYHVITDEIKKRKSKK